MTTHEMRTNTNGGARRLVLRCLITIAAGILILQMNAHGVLVGALGINPILLEYAVAFLLGIAVGVAFPELWMVAPLLASALDMTLFIYEVATRNMNMWPIGLAFRLFWILVMYAGSALGHLWVIHFGRPR